MYIVGVNVNAFKVAEKASKDGASLVVTETGAIKEKLRMLYWDSENGPVYSIPAMVPDCPTFFLQGISRGLRVPCSYLSKAIVLFLGIHICAGYLFSL